MVTHDPRVAAYADRIIFLKDGHVVDETALERNDSSNYVSVVNKIKQIGD